jgi:hypothetical protein
MATEQSGTVLLKRHKRTLYVVAAIILALIVLSEVVGLIADYLWFDALGYASVFTTEFWTKILLWAGGLVVTTAWLAGHVILACRLSPGHHFQVKGVNWTLSASKIRKYVMLAGVGFGVIVGLGFAQGAEAQWFDVLQFLHRADFGWTDPILERDAQAYVFVVPLVQGLKGYAMSMAIFGALGAAAAYFLNGAIGWQYARMTRASTVHLAALVAMVLLAVALGYWLDRYELLLAPGGIVFGAGYVDATVRMGLLAFMAAFSVVVAAAVVVAGVRMKPKIAGGAVALLVVVHVAVVWAYPGLVQRFDVDPNELVRERPYLVHNIEGTRFAFDLADVQVEEYPAGEGIDPADLADAGDTLANIRLWDYRALTRTYNELQGLRPYYQFGSETERRFVDTDRYHLGPQYRQVSLAVRELLQQRLPQQSQTWPNLHLMYTHGYGLCMSPVNEFTEESGRPELWIRDIPPKATVPIELDDPSIYYGEETTNYVFVRTRQDEFHYPVGDENVYTQYEHDAGIPVASYLKRMLFAYYFQDWNILLTDNFTAETRLLWRRNIHDRVQRLAPFLEFDDDPYPVVADGRIVWIVDAYTGTDRFPYSQPLRLRGYGRRLNYIRNAVKATVDAVTGEVRFYVVDPDDAMVQVARRIFPSLFRDMDEMPESLRRHLRYPIDLMDIQAEQYFMYHMTDPRVFYNREDLWQRPQELYRGAPQPVKAYYIIMRLPGGDAPEYLLMLPVTPTRKNNMIAWMAGRCDGAHYGKLLVYKFPKKRLILGPQQIEANIDKNDAISRQISLWDQRGSRVLRGNLLVIPIGDSVLYVEPLYLDSEQTEFPELRRVIVATSDRVAMRPTLEEALDAALGAAPPVAEEPPAEPPPEEGPTEETPPEARPAPAGTAAEALDAYREAQQHLKRGDWAEYGEAMERLEKALRKMAEPGSTPSDE